MNSVYDQVDAELNTPVPRARLNRAQRRELGLYTRRFKTDSRAPKAIPSPWRFRRIETAAVMGA